MKKNVWAQQTLWGTIRLHAWSW